MKDISHSFYSGTRKSPLAIRPSIKFLLRPILFRITFCDFQWLVDISRALMCRGFLSNIVRGSNKVLEISYTQLNEYSKKIEAFFADEPIWEDNNLKYSHGDSLCKRGNIKQILPAVSNLCCVKSYLKSMG